MSKLCIILILIVLNAITETETGWLTIELDRGLLLQLCRPRPKSQTPGVYLYCNNLCSSNSSPVRPWGRIFPQFPSQDARYGF